LENLWTEFGFEVDCGSMYCTNDYEDFIEKMLGESEITAWEFIKAYNTRMFVRENDFDDIHDFMTFRPVMDYLAERCKERNSKMLHEVLATEHTEVILENKELDNN
jgi:hypothetical protein